MAMRAGRMAAVMAVVGLGMMAPAAKAAGPKGRLRMLFADVEGGQATLLVTPGGESLLIDTGWPGHGGRDADRIVALCKRAGVQTIDNVVITHFHTDHVGGLPELAAKIRIGRVIDHGDNTETSDPATVAGWAAYQKLLADGKIKRLSVKVGDVLPMEGVRAEVVSAAGKVLQRPLTGGGAGARNAACAASPEKALEGSENDMSVGLMITFGGLRVLDLGDLTWGEERGVVCPVNKLGRVDLLIVSHHGAERSSSPALVAAVRPRVAVMDNGAHKGGEAGTFRTLAAPASGGGVLWTLHTAEGVPAGLNVDAARIANRPGEDGNWIEVDGSGDGSLAVTNGRTGATVQYPGGSVGHRS